MLDDHPVRSEDFEEMKAVKLNNIENDTHLKLMEIKRTEK